MEKVESRLISGNACCHSLLNHFLLNYCVKMYGSVTVPAQPQGDVHTVDHKYIYISLLHATCFGFCGKAS